MLTLSLFLMLMRADDKELVIGPEVGKAVPALQALQIVGDQADKQLDWSAQAKDHPTILVFIRSDKWERPVARILKQLDDAMIDVRKNDAKAHVGIIWISSDLDKAKEYLPKAAQSLKLQASSWNCFHGEVYDVTGWQLSGDGAVNIVVIKEGKATWGRAFATMQESIVKQAMQAFKAK